MVRHLSFDDPRVGQNRGNNFKVTGSDKHRQRIAYIPGEVLVNQLVVSKELQQRAHRPDMESLHQRASMGDPRAQAAIADVEDALQEIDDINKLKEVIERRLKANPPSAQVWTNERGVKVILHPATVAQEVLWVQDVGPVIYREGIPPELISKKPETTYGLVILEYELDDHDAVRIVPEKNQIDLGGGHKQIFNYQLWPWSINTFKAKEWKEHSRNHPTIFCDYEVWTDDKDKKYPKVKFAPVGPAIWRQDPAVMSKVIREARKVYAELPSTMARDFPLEELIDLLQPKGSGARGGTGYAPAAPSAPAGMELMDFAAMLGGTPEDQANTALEHLPSGDSASLDDDLNSLIPGDPDAQDHVISGLFSGQ